MALLGSKRGDKRADADKGKRTSAPVAPGAAPPQKLPPPNEAKAPGPRTATGSGSGQAPPGTAPAPARPTDRPGTMIPARSRRSAFESVFMRLIATAGIVAIGVAVAAIMASSNAQGWIIGLVVSLLAVIMAAVLWSSRRL